MSVDWAAHYDAIYDSIGVAAVLTLADTAGTEHALTAIDKTAGVAIESDGVSVHSVKPGACLRMAELANLGVTREELADAELALNNATWRVLSSHPRPSPAGEARGEVLLILTEAA